ncbi:MAG TPA: hypothetical protein VNI52_05210 [Sphingobacteriaceae bacterium]|nr:hypothetical protein [Sphingobacteriaceae bacterium]
MKNLRSSGLFITLIIIALAVHGQKKSDIATRNPWLTAVVDAKQKEWGDSLPNFDSDTKFRYQISNDKDNIYLAIATSDKQRIQNIISGGISFFITTEGKKKDGQTVIFPVAIPRKANQKITNPEQLVRQSLASAKAIQVIGFKEILDGNISVNNDYGIKTTALLNSDGYYVYEAAIPLNRLNLTSNSSQELSINIRLNIPDRPPHYSRVYESPYEMQRRRRQGDYGAQQSRTVVSTTQPAGFWIKRTLAAPVLAK